jgi:Tfp pilus assembly protein PilX
MRDTAMEERMAGNFRDYAAALEAAESALRTGEAGIINSTVFRAMVFNQAGGTYSVGPASQSIDPFTAGNFGMSVSSPPSDVDTNRLADLYIEKLPEVELFNSDLVVGFQDGPPRVSYYRTTGRGFGLSPNTEVILQSTYWR